MGKRHIELIKGILEGRYRKEDLESEIANMQRPLQLSLSKRCSRCYTYFFPKKGNGNTICYVCIKELEKEVEYDNTPYSTR